MSKKTHVSPLAPRQALKPTPVSGVAMATARAGIKHRDRDDVLIMAFAPGTSVAGVFTRSKCAGAPVEWCKAILSKGVARGLVVNSGNANAFTGEKGRKATRATAEILAQYLDCNVEEIYLASTGVIGEPLDTSKFAAVIPAMSQRLQTDAFDAAAAAIMTTDTYPKLAAASVEFAEGKVQLVGIAKGSGMIAPDMATTLAFLFTDAPIESHVLQALLTEQIEDSFNAITVDSDTSTSDTVLLFATGKSSEPVVTTSDRRLEGFREALSAILLDLALQVVKDGEGARKFLTVSVTGAQTKASARKVALSVANSPLVKCAVGGEDANWGRVAMAVGKSGVAIERDRMSIRFGDLLLAENGMRAPSYDESSVSAYMTSASIEITIDLGLGDVSDRVYGCDLSSEYVSINGNYRS